MFSFAHPWLFLLLPLPLMIHWLVPPWRDRQQAVHTPFFDDLVALSGQTPGSGSIIRRRTGLQTVVVALCWLLLIAALARPQWIEPPVVKEIPSRDLLLGVDLSASMLTEDFTSADGQKTDRLTAVKEVLDDFLRRRKGDRVGLILFGTAPFIQAPFTQDLDTVRELMREARVGMAGPKTAFGDAIGLAITLFKQSRMQDKLLIMLTDGNDTSSRLEPEKAADIASDEDIVIHAVGLGDPRAAGEQKLDEETLKAVARSTGGDYFWAGDRSSLDRIYQRIDQLSTHKIERISYRPRLDLYYWPLAAVIVLSLLLYAGMLIGRRVRG